jgi:RNA polymerase sigma-70 factor (ECF subfamily)
LDDRSVQADADVAAAIAGDRAALRRVWTRNRNWVAAILLAHKPRSVETEDLLQSVAVTLVQRIGDVRDERALKPWLRTVAVNAARAAGRRHQVERRARPRLAREDRDCGSETESAERGRALLEMAREIPEGYREPLLLRCVNGMSHREIAQVLELPETTIETRIARGRRMLRDLATQRERGPVETPAACEGVADA